jgi:hypothetical protein
MKLLNCFTGSRRDSSAIFRELSQRGSAVRAKAPRFQALLGQPKRLPFTSRPRQCKMVLDVNLISISSECSSNCSLRIRYVESNAWRHGYPPPHKPANARCVIPPPALPAPGSLCPLPRYSHRSTRRDRVRGSPNPGWP